MERDEVEYRTILSEMFAAYPRPGRVDPLPEYRTRFHVVHGWFMRCMRDAEALLALQDAGFAVEGAPILRSLIEHSVSLTWVVTDPATAETVIRRQNAEAAEKRLQAFNLAGWDALPAESFAPAIADGQQLESGADFQKHFRQRCLLVAEPDDFAAWVVASADSHATLQSSVPYSRLDADGMLTILKSPDPVGSRTSTSCIYLHLAYRSLNTAMVGSPWSGQLMNWGRRMLQLIGGARVAAGLEVPPGFYSAKPAVLVEKRSLTHPNDGS